MKGAYYATKLYTYSECNIPMSRTTRAMRQGVRKEIFLHKWNPEIDFLTSIMFFSIFVHLSHLQ